MEIHLLFIYLGDLKAITRLEWLDAVVLLVTSMIAVIGFKFDWKEGNKVTRAGKIGIVLTAAIFLIGSYFKLENYAQNHISQSIDMAYKAKINSTDSASLAQIDSAKIAIESTRNSIADAKASIEDAINRLDRINRKSNSILRRTNELNFPLSKFDVDIWYEITVRRDSLNKYCPMFRSDSLKYSFIKSHYFRSEKDTTVNIPLSIFKTLAYRDYLQGTGIGISFIKDTSQSANTIVTGPYNGASTALLLFSNEDMPGDELVCQVACSNKIALISLWGHFKDQSLNLTKYKIWGTEDLINLFFTTNLNAPNGIVSASLPQLIISTDKRKLILERLKPRNGNFRIIRKISPNDFY